ncbi:hypothetical protein J7T55_007171 [Diaporthe amygdali]|uniref:uncharacterized protein n=1 Tax=Phomopsis amygdali TaxID=1214568 RepID=UPI0022FE78D7|nr:uncharacterized protein J7T55_007171 [Diaporthe amygdali]KAJ0108053.1 hypothetical protein J7T55_007171 [Diaporthe amygdali]
MMVSSVRPSKKHYDSSSSASSYGSFSSSDSDVSASSLRASMERPVASIEIIRCLRCARSVEMTTTDDASMYGMIRVGTGIYYCDSTALPPTLPPLLNPIDMLHQHNTTMNAGEHLEPPASALTGPPSAILVPHSIPGQRPLR